MVKCILKKQRCVHNDYNVVVILIFCKSGRYDFNSYFASSTLPSPTIRTLYVCGINYILNDPVHSSFSSDVLHQFILSLISTSLVKLAIRSRV